MSLIVYKLMKSSVSPSALKQRGFTLIEVMVAVVVLAVGLLGLAGLQATSLRFNDSAYQRSQATALAYDMVDRMRANRREAISTSGNPYNLPTSTPALTCTSGAAAGATLAAQDVAAWRNALACLLPSGTGSVVRQGTNNVFTITVRWNDKREEATAANRFLALSVDTEI